MPYYGLYIPIKSGGSGGSGSSSLPASGNFANGSSGGGSDSSAQNSDSPYVFFEKSEALEVLKMHKDARLREFSSEDDALRYAQTGYEVVQTKYADVKTSTAAVEKAPFRAPTKQELIEFRKIIEAGDYERIKSIIWDNPRYLVSSGDTPTTLKEGYRYNAMHVCAISKKPRIAELILQTVSNTKFVDLLTGKKNDEKMCKELCVNLLDYYLNIPEKGRSETPLHFAAKNGTIEMVEVLTSYPECKMTPNSEGLLPKEIICHRVAQAPPELCKRIEALLEERFYVPVIRSVDNAIPPQIGQPFSANNPPNLNCDLLSPEVKIQALAGPMNKEQAKQFCRRWKTPPRMGSSNASSPITNNPFISPMKSRMNNNSTPTKSTYAINNSCETPTTSLHRRTLFNSPAQSHVLKEQNLSTTLEDNGDNDTSFVDEQNGNHKNEEDKSAVTAIVITSETCESIALEANNNQEQQQAEEQEQPSIERLSTLPNPMYPNTPMLKMKKEMFFTYREQHVPSPVVFDAPNDSCGSSNDSTNSFKFEYDSPDGIERESRLKQNAARKTEHKPPMRPPQMSMLRTALCPKTPMLKMKKELNSQFNENNITWDRGPGDMRYDSPGFKERHIKITDTEKGLEVIGRELAKEQKIEWREYWDFLNQFIDIASPYGLDKLENYFAQRIKDEEMSKKTAQAMANSAVILDNVCNVLEKFGFVKNSAASGGSGGSTGGASKDGRNGFNIERNRFDNYYPSSSSASSTATATAAVAPQTTNPYTCVEKSLQVFAKRMTKTIIHNIENVVSINDTLLSELKRLKSLICSFKEDVRFLNVNFTKVHSRIGNLISIYLENSQEVTEAVKLKIQNIIQNLLLTPGERREHIECVSTRILLMLERSTEQILPENLKTEDMCSKVWLQEKECECQWETNLSRKTSRRNRMEARYKSHQHARQQEKSKKDLVSVASGNFEDWRDIPSMGGNDSSDEMEEDIYWSDFGGSDSDDEDDVWATPPESPSRISLMENSEYDGYSIYVYGNEPTKRDLDVLNAIFHIDIDKLKHPNIHSWKCALLRYPNEEMDYFPSPSIVKKSHSFVMRNSGTKNDFPQTPLAQKNQHNSSMKPSTLSTSSATTTPQQSQSQNKQYHQLPTAKRLFMSPSRSKSIPTTIQANPTPSSTPLNKIRGLFSAYRAERSPMLSASPAAAFSSDRSGSEGSNNLSLLNISASE